MLIAKVLASGVYNSHKAPSEDKCYGDGCFLLAHLAIVAIELVGVALGVILTLRTRVVYTALAYV